MPMADICKEITESNSHRDFTGEHEPECMLDAEAVIALDLHTTPLEIQNAIAQPEEERADCHDLHDNDDCADIFNQW